MWEKYSDAGTAKCVSVHHPALASWLGACPFSQSTVACALVPSACHAHLPHLLRPVLSWHLFSPHLTSAYLGKGICFCLQSIRMDQGENEGISGACTQGLVCLPVASTAKGGLRSLVWAWPSLFISNFVKGLKQSSESSSRTRGTCPGVQVPKEVWTLYNTCELSPKPQIVMISCFSQCLSNRSRQWQSIC